VQFQIGVEGRLVGTVGNDFNAPEEPAPATVADVMMMVAESLAQATLQVGTPACAHWQGERRVQ
jgi:hypothetical protein